MSAVSSMIAATHGVKSEPVSVLDFMPSDSVPWMKRKKAKRGGITDPKLQQQMVMTAFGFKK